MNIIKDCEQGSDQWFNHRFGSIGGSGIKKAVAGGSGITRTKYLFQKADEILSKRRIITYQNDDMCLGTDSETYSRSTYSFLHDVEVEEIALIKEGDHKHYSADGLIDHDGIVEIKNTNGPNYLQIITKDCIPTEHISQIQWGLHISQREWCDYIQACWIREEGEIVPRYPDRPIWVKRIYRDGERIQKLDQGADEFLAELALLIKKLKSL